MLVAIEDGRKEDEKDDEADDEDDEVFVHCGLYIISGEFACGELHDDGGGFVKPVVKIALLEVGDDVVFDDSARKRIGKNGFNAIAGGDGNFALLFGNEQHHAIVFAFSAHAPQLA